MQKSNNQRSEQKFSKFKRNIQIKEMENMRNKGKILGGLRYRQKAADLIGREEREAI